VEAFPDAQQAVESAKSSDLLIIDTPGRIADATTSIARQSHLIVQPTGPGSDDLHVSVLVFLALERVGIARERLAFALCNVLSADEERDARAYLSSFGYDVLEGSIPAHPVYRAAMRVGRSITETRQKTLDGRVDRLMADLLQKAIGNTGRKKRGTRD
jgi:cellulose biosynthesis protein BcsQ